MTKWKTEAHEGGATTTDDEQGCEGWRTKAQVTMNEGTSDDEQGHKQRYEQGHKWNREQEYENEQRRWITRTNEEDELQEQKQSLSQ